MLRAYGARGEKKLYGRVLYGRVLYGRVLYGRVLYGKVLEGVIRSTVVVDPDGRVALAQYNVKATGHVGRLRRELALA